MRSIACVGTVCLVASLSAHFLPLASGQLPVATGGITAQPTRPREPGGKLGDQIGVYRTIEGVRSVGGKVETGTLLVDTVDGRKLDKPIPLVVRGGVIVNQNIQESVLRFPEDQRFVFKGFETGEMIGVPPAVEIAAQEQGWTEIPVSAAGWSWRPYFVALVAVEPKGFELRR
jgi:hypothetical protein